MKASSTLHRVPDLRHPPSPAGIRALHHARARTRASQPHHHHPTPCSSLTLALSTALHRLPPAILHHVPLNFLPPTARLPPAVATTTCPRPTPVDPPFCSSTSPSVFLLLPSTAPAARSLPPHTLCLAHPTQSVICSVEGRGYPGWQRSGKAGTPFLRPGAEPKKGSERAVGCLKGVLFIGEHLSEHPHEHPQPPSPLSPRSSVTLRLHACLC